MDGGMIEKVEVNIEKDEPLKLELASFIECAKAGSVPEVSGQQGADALDLALEITNQIANAANEIANTAKADAK